MSGGGSLSTSSSIVKLEPLKFEPSTPEQYESLPIEMMSMQQPSEQVVVSSTSLTGSTLDTADTTTNIECGNNNGLASSAAAASFSAFYNQFLIMNLLQQHLKTRGVEASSCVKRKTHLSHCFMQVSLRYRI